MPVLSPQRQDRLSEILNCHPQRPAHPVLAACPPAVNPVQPETIGRNLFVGAALKEAGLQEVLAACSGVHSLVLIEDVGPSALPSLGAMEPRPLHVHLTHLFGNIASIDPSHPMFAALTHLDLFNDNIAALPGTTSTALPAWGLTVCTRLGVLINMQSTPPSAEHFLFDRMRFMYLVVADTDYVSDWVVGTKDGLDFWARADAFLAKKRRREIKPGVTVNMNWKALSRRSNRVIQRKFRLDTGGGA
ncbi:hypothetical protein DFH09DRAFT_1071136 [Mycena vulgaris]|nr:hypothetical protein DFH09DRAFT_1071136 [Mycena vulgaris]